MKFVLIPVMALAGALTAAPAAAAQEATAYPAKPIRLVVPFTPGGTTDILARMIGLKLSEAYGQQVIIDNRPGAGGTIGVEIVSRSAPNGYTLVMGHIGTFGVNPSLYAKLPYDAVKDFQPITLVALVPNLLSVHPGLAARSVKELIALGARDQGYGRKARLSATFAQVIPG